MAAKKTPTSRSSRLDAIALLKADHRQVEDWFAKFEKASKSKKQQLASSICEALTVHTIIEEEIFYPAFLQATEDKDMHHEAVVEHAGAKELIAQIQRMSPDDDYFDAKVTVLSEMIKHHVKKIQHGFTRTGRRVDGPQEEIAGAGQGRLGGQRCDPAFAHQVINHAGDQHAGFETQIGAAQQTRHQGAVVQVGVTE